MTTIPHKINLITRQKWTRELGSIQLGYDGVWRA